MGIKLRKKLDDWLGTKFHLYGRRKKSTTDRGACDCIGLIFGLAKDLNLLSPKKAEYLVGYDHCEYQLHDDQQKIEKFLDEHFYLAENLSFYQIILFQMDDFFQHVGMTTRYTEGKIGIIHADLRSRQIVEHYLDQDWHQKIKKIYEFNI